MPVSTTLWSHRNLGLNAGSYLFAMQTRGYFISLSLSFFICRLKMKIIDKVVKMDELLRTLSGIKLVHQKYLLPSYIWLCLKLAFRVSQSTCVYINFLIQKIQLMIIFLFIPQVYCENLVT